MSFDSKEFRNALGAFATGICLISRPNPENDDAPTGILVNSFTSVSLEPPSVLWCLGKSSNRFEPFMQSESFGVNILSADQQDLSDGFAGGTMTDFDGVDTETWDTGAAILPAAMVNLECTVADRHDYGDHIIIIGEVTRLRVNTPDAPLLYHAGGYGRLADSE